MKKNILLTIILGIFFIPCNSQSNAQVKKIFSNKSIKFRVIHTPTKLLDSNKIEISQTLIEVYLPKSSLKKIESLKLTDWIELLSDVNTDWATCLYLYDRYKRDASQLDIKGGRKFWVRCCKKHDIIYWEEALSKK